MEAVYKKIVEMFKDHPEVFTERSLPIIRQIDINIGQPEDPENFEVFCPSIFISWQITSGGSSEPDKLVLEFDVLQEPGKPTDSISEQLDAGLEYMRMLKAVKYILNRLRCDNITPLQYAGERPKITQYFRYHVLSYTCSIDAYTDSISRPATGSGTIESIKVNEGRIKQKYPVTNDVPDIDIFSL